MKEVFRPLVTSFTWRAEGYTSLRLCSAHVAANLSKEDKANILERYRKKVRAR